jgi:hypothetical protein
MDFWDTSIKTKLYEVAFVVVFPELMAALALRETIDAWNFRKALRVLPGWERFSLKQAFLTQKGGVTLQSQNLRKPNQFYDQARSGNIFFRQLRQNSQIVHEAKATGSLK